ncbi:MAG: nitroreductase family protein [Caulobacter sp.]|nr:nitroreductase family protein [Caulobacter sp.]
MLDTLEAPPAFGQPIPLRGPCVSTLDLLANRRSTSAMLLSAPAPTAPELDQILTLAARAPDHGKLFPWRFIIIEGQAKVSFAERLEVIGQARPDCNKAVAALGKLKTPPLCVAVVSRVTEGKIPEWEQVLSSGAVCMNMLLAAAALGYGANWITDWYSYDPQALAMLGLGEGERVAGYLHIGTPIEPQLERARPDMAAIVSRLEAV